LAVPCLRDPTPPKKTPFRQTADQTFGRFIIFRRGCESAVDTRAKPAYDDHQLKQLLSNGAIHAY
jgi:hypothetical protein